MNDEAEQESRWRLAALWFGFLAGPAAWFAHLMIGYIVGAYLCQADATWALHLFTLGAVAVCAVSGVVSWRLWRETGSVREPEGGGVLGRTRFMALSGVVLSALFALIVVTAGLSNVFLEPCGAR